MGQSLTVIFRRAALFGAVAVASAGLTLGIQAVARPAPSSPALTFVQCERQTRLDLPDLTVFQVRQVCQIVTGG